MIRVLRARAKKLLAVFAFAPLGHADLLNKFISLSRSAIRWENKKEGNAGFQKKRDGAGGSVFVSRGGSILISVEATGSVM